MRKATNQPLKALAGIPTNGDKTIWRRIGTAFPLKNRAGYSLKLECIPAPIDGLFQLILVENNDQPDTAG